MHMQLEVWRVCSPRIELASVQQICIRDINLHFYDLQLSEKLIYSTNFHPNSRYSAICMTA